MEPDAESTHVTGSSSCEFVCAYQGCSYVFQKRSRLDDHLRTHTGERPFVCEASGCGKSYTRASHLKRHLVVSHEQSKEPRQRIRCTSEGCAHMFLSSDTLKKHLMRIHGEQKYKCPEEGCSEAFRKRHQLKAHSYEHKGVLPFQCEKCKKKFSQHSKLDAHAKVHEGYTCPWEGCGLSFGKWSLLRKHKAVMHLEYKCSACGKHFQHKGLFKDHILTHKGDLEKLSCPREGCDRQYTSKRNLRSHIKSFHDKLRFACEHEGCDKTFSFKHKLKEHLHTHTESYTPPQRVYWKKSGLTKVMEYVLMTEGDIKLQKNRRKQPAESVGHDESVDDVNTTANTVQDPQPGTNVKSSTDVLSVCVGKNPWEDSQLNNNFKFGDFNNGVLESKMEDSGVDLFPINNSAEVLPSGATDDMEVLPSSGIHDLKVLPSGATDLEVLLSRVTQDIQVLPSGNKMETDLLPLGDASEMETSPISDTQVELTSDKELGSVHCSQTLSCCKEPLNNHRCPS